VRGVIPFWILAFVGLGLSLWMVSIAQHEAARSSASHLETAMLVNMAALLAFGIVWIGKFVAFSRWMFVDEDPSWSSTVDRPVEAGEEELWRT
jgi:uncharacterized membrane protein